MSLYQPVHILPYTFTLYIFTPPDNKWVVYRYSFALAHLSYCRHDFMEWQRSGMWGHLCPLDTFLVL
jgi:hypothetical protein